MLILKKLKHIAKYLSSFIRIGGFLFVLFSGRYLGFLKHPLRRKQEKAQCWDSKIWGTKDTLPTSTCWGSATACWGIRSKTTGKIRSEGSWSRFCLTFTVWAGFAGDCPRTYKIGMENCTLQWNVSYWEHTKMTCMYFWAEICIYSSM